MSETNSWPDGLNKVISLASSASWSSTVDSAWRQTMASIVLSRTGRLVYSAKVTGALDTGTSNPNDTFGITAFNIALEDDALFEWIELSLTGTGTVSFSLLDDSGTTFTSDAVGDFIFDLANGQNKFAFQSVNGQSIAGLSFTVAGGTVDTVSQVRIDPAFAVVPEPATWGMMLLGFGVIGFAIRRKRRPVLTQLA